MRSHLIALSALLAQTAFAAVPVASFPTEADRQAAAVDGLASISFPDPQRTFWLYGPENIGVFTVLVAPAPDGSVERARAQAANRTLAEELERIVAGWRFAPEVVAHREPVEVRFELKGVRKTDDEPAGLFLHYESPRRVVVRKIDPITERLDRSDPEVAKASCAVHRVPMRIVVVPIRYGLQLRKDPRWWNYAARQRNRFWRAVERLFPNADLPVSGGCMVGPEDFAEKLVCPACEVAKKRWLAAHAGFKP